MVRELATTAITTPTTEVYRGACVSKTLSNQVTHIHSKTKVGQEFSFRRDAILWYINYRKYGSSSEHVLELGMLIAEILADLGIAPALLFELRDAVVALSCLARLDLPHHVKLGERHE